MQILNGILVALALYFVSLPMYFFHITLVNKMPPSAPNAYAGAEIEVLFELSISATHIVEKNKLTRRLS
jgi:hypothetical protein